MSYPRTPMSPKPLNLELWKSPLKILTNRLEIDENANRAHLIRHWLAVKWCHKQSESFCPSPKWLNADRTQYVRSSSCLITIVVTTLLFAVMRRWVEYGLLPEGICVTKLHSLVFPVTFGQRQLNRRVGSSQSIVNYLFLWSMRKAPLVCFPPMTAN